MFPFMETCHCMLAWILVGLSFLTGGLPLYHKQHLTVLWYLSFWLAMVCHYLLVPPPYLGSPAISSSVCGILFSCHHLLVLALIVSSIHVPPECTHWGGYNNTVSRIPDSLKKCTPTNCVSRKKDPKMLTPPSFISSAFHFDVLIWMTTSLQRELLFL